MAAMGPTAGPLQKYISYWGTVGPNIFRSEQNAAIRVKAIDTFCNAMIIYQLFVFSQQWNIIEYSYFDSMYFTYWVFIKIVEYKCSHFVGYCIFCVLVLELVKHL